jgi:hypothetical protein
LPILLKQAQAAGVCMDLPVNNDLYLPEKLAE